MEIALLVLAGLVAVWLVIAAAGAFPLILLWFADFRYVSDPQSTIPLTVQRIGTKWFTDAGLTPEGVIRPLGISMALFRQHNQHTAVAIYSIGSAVVMDITTTYPNDVEINTTTTPDGILLPLKPGSLLQCLPSSTFDDLWQKHVEAVQLLRTQLNVTEVPIGPLDEFGAESEIGRIRYLFCRPWLILTLPYRFFVTKTRYRNVTIAMQVERGWINIHALSDRVRSGAS